ncbi:calcium-binding protein [Microvirga sp. CF3062]|uniref:calcium-binding protein n=1 Tax=Microvirga sp. CF3062 TaxID=3110182 RepID=UPI002E776B57|nr:calcium-binding protein [Microvirga sp. CF3062]MEE1656577.1 calcium-binding protein [Microvirga sp. CF3062]
MADYLHDSPSNTYRLEPDTQDFSLSEVHGQGAANVEGNLRDNVITGNDANNSLDGNGGADTLIGGLGDDQYFVDNSDDVVIEGPADGSVDEVIAYISYSLPANVETLVLRGLDPIDGIGNDQANALIGNSVNNRMLGGNGDDRLFGGDGNDTLDGGAGADLLWGDAGDDTFIIDEDNEITEDPNAGIDWVIASFGYTLGSNLENLRLSGALPLTGIGNGLDNYLIGAQGNDTLEGHDGQDTLDGGAGADRLEGGAGDDVYGIDHADDRVLEIGGAGHDRVETLVSYSLAVFVEDLFAAGSAPLSLVGNALANSIQGNAAANTLDGSAGADTLAGGQGNDTYVVDGLDTIIELVGGGIDTILSALSYSLDESLDHLTATGQIAVTLTGNALDNIITGNAAANTLDGAAGADHLLGGAGGDTYIVDGSDWITELAGEGIDTVLAGSSYTLGADLENLIASAPGAIDLTGNSLNNTLIGNDAANRLDGGAGSDVLRAGAGDDIYVADGADTIIEEAGGGTDTVIAGTTFSLLPFVHVENLKAATGRSNIAMTGNKSANALTGNEGANKLYGGDGNDQLKGGSGKDAFVFNTKLSKSTNVDKILDFSSSADSIFLENKIFTKLGSGSSKGKKLTLDMFVEGGRARDKEDRIIYDKKTGTLSYDKDGAGGAAQVKIATLTNKAKLYYHDFFVI